jgi:hypothetical protein
VNNVPNVFHIIELLLLGGRTIKLCGAKEAQRSLHPNEPLVRRLLAYRAHTVALLQK